MKLYWIEKLKSGDLQLHAFDGHHIANEPRRFQESVGDAIKKHRDYLERRLTKCREDIRSLEIEMANLNELETEASNAKEK